MRNWLKIGLRNLLKNKRRSVFTVGAIAMGFAAINIFGGFTEYMFRGLQDSFIYAHGNGHLTIFKEGFLDEGVLFPHRYQLSAADVEQIRSVCAGADAVLRADPELHLTGLISNGRVSTIFVGAGRHPDAVAAVIEQAESSIGKLKMYEGRPLSSSESYGIGVSRGLADRLGLDLGDAVILMATTLEGQMNALDGEVFQIFDAPIEVLNNKMVYLTAAYARTLMDTDTSDRMSVLLRKNAPLQKTLDRLSAALEKGGVAVDIRTWEEMRVSYLRIRNMFRIIFAFVFVVVFLIVVLSVVNTVSMTVLERTREIGALRAMGLRRRGVAVMFAVESALLGGLGSIAGAALTVGVWAAIRGLEPTWIPPNIPKRVPWEIILTPGYLVSTFVVLIGLSVLAAVLPARRAARMAIIDALGHI